MPYSTLINIASSALSTLYFVQLVQILILAGLALDVVLVLSRFCLFFEAVYPYPSWFCHLYCQILEEFDEIRGNVFGFFDSFYLNQLATVVMRQTVAPPSEEDLLSVFEFDYLAVWFSQRHSNKIIHSYLTHSSQCRHADFSPPERVIYPVFISFLEANTVIEFAIFQDNRRRFFLS